MEVSMFGGTWKKRESSNTGFLKNGIIFLKKPIELTIMNRLRSSK